MNLLRSPVRFTWVRRPRRQNLGRHPAYVVASSPAAGRSPQRTFVVQYCRVEIHPSARRHGSADDDILHAIENSMVVDDLGEDPDRWLVIGPDRAANLLEIVVLIATEGNELIIPPCPCGPSTGGCSNHDQANLRTHDIRYSDR